jgi:hypothetical protein
MVATEMVKSDERRLKRQSFRVPAFRNPVGRYCEIGPSILIRPNVHGKGDLSHRGLEKMLT